MQNKLKEINKLADTKHDYNDIIYLPHHVSNKHRKMPIYNRSSQFCPFSALNGYDEKIKEMARLTHEKIEIGEGLQDILNYKLQIIKSNVNNHPLIKITYFIKDVNKTGGKYVDITKNIKIIDTLLERIIFMNKKVITIKDIINIEGDIFKDE